MQIFDSNHANIGEYNYKMYMFGLVQYKINLDCECQQTCSVSMLLIGQQTRHVLACLHCQPIRCGNTPAVTKFRPPLEQ